MSNDKLGEWSIGMVVGSPKSTIADSSGEESNSINASATLDVDGSSTLDCGGGFITGVAVSGGGAVLNCP